MACFMNPGFWTYIIILIGLVMIIRLVVPSIIAFFGLGGVIGQVLMIILWVIIACIGIYFLFAIIGCFGSLSIPTFPHGR